jgi:outer membrane lipoprotein-sorting protein
MRYLLAAALALWMVLVPTPSAAAGAREILDEVRRLEDTTRHWTDRSEKLSLTIVDARGSERRRELKVFNKRYPGDEEKALSFFLEPSEVKGTAFLQWGHKKTADDQWLYLPDIRRTRRITAELRNESFMGTDFSYQDLEILGEIQGWTEEEAPSTLVGEEQIAGSPCHVIRLQPKQEGMRYGRIQLWLDRDKLVTRRMDFFDKDDAAVKSLTLERIEDVGRFPTPHVLEMRNLKTGSRTRLEVSDVKYDAGLSDELFTQRYLERGTSP